MAKKTTPAPSAAKQTAHKPTASKSAAQKSAAPVKATAEKTTAPAVAAPTKTTTPIKVSPQPSLVSPTALIETLATRRQESLNSAIAQLHALHSQMLHAAGRHANTALQFINSAPKSGTLADMIEWQSRWFLSHAHVHQDGVKALGTLATKNMEHLQKSLRVDLPRQAG